MENLTQKLKILGLDDKDIAVYLAILTLGKSTITDISRKSAIKRTTIYSYLDNLLKFGLIFKTVDKKRIYYCPENPDKIKSVLEKQKTEIDEKKEKINLVIPELENLYSSSFNRPRISFYESKEGLREIYWQMLDTHKKVYSIFSPDNFFQI
ncbi:MAG: helix-turn-helix domain-containing protein, partial [Patescibacteria group bacterium]